MKAVPVLICVIAVMAIVSYAAFTYQQQRAPQAACEASAAAVLKDCLDDHDQDFCNEFGRAAFNGCTNYVKGKP